MGKTIVSRILSWIMAFLMLFTTSTPALMDEPDDSKNFTTENGTAITVIQKVGGKDEVVGRLTESGMQWVKNLDYDKDYYINVSVPRDLGEKYLAVSTGNFSGKINGMAYANMPGQTISGLAVRDLDAASTLSRIVYVDDYAVTSTYDVLFGSTKKGYTVINGDVVYQIAKSHDASANAVINFQLGIHIDPNLYDNFDIMEKGIVLKVGDYDPETHKVTPLEGYEQDMDIPVNARPELAPCGYNNTVSAALNHDSVALLGRIDNQSKVQMFYEKAEFDIRVPVGVLVSDVGFDATMVKENGTYGVLSFTGPEVDEATNENVYHVEIEDGLKGQGTQTPFAYTMKPTSPYFAPGDTFKTHYTDIVYYLENDGVYQFADSVYSTVTVVDGDADASLLTSNDRNVYNSTIDTDHPYMILLGRGQVQNKSQSPSPYEKIYEADFNINKSDAVITACAVPSGDRLDPEIILTGYDKNGDLISVTVENPEQYRVWYNNNDNGYAFMAKDFGIENLTHVYADIGRLVGAYFYDNTWTAHPNLEANIGGCWGYFTNDTAGIQVRTDYHLYNKEPAFRSMKNGDLRSRSTYTSTDIKIGGVCQDGDLTVIDVTTNKKSIVNTGKTDTAPAIEPGDTVSLSARLMLGRYTFANYRTNNQEFIVKNNDYLQTVEYLADPVFYITLPADFRLEDLTFNRMKRTILMSNKSAGPVYGVNSWTVSDEDKNIPYTLENVSYLNTTGDGVSIYKVSFPDDVGLGIYDENGNMQALTYTITIGTSKSSDTNRYPLSKLMQITGDNPMAGAIYSSDNTTTAYNYTVPDKYGINGGNDLPGTTYGLKNPNSALGFSIQKLSDVVTNNYITVSKIDGEPQPESWCTYLRNDPNSIALLGAKSAGKYKVVIQNTDPDHATGKMNVYVPIPKKGENMGTAFMNQAAQFSMDFTFDEEAFAADGFTAQYIKIEKTDKDDLINGVVYELCEHEEANAILLTTDGMPKNKIITLEFGFEVDSNVNPKELNLFHNCLTYTDYAGTKFETRVSSNVAVEVAPGTITGKAFYDANRNATLDPGEVGIPGIAVRVVDSNGRFQNIITDAQGNYKFSAVRESDIDVNFTVDESSIYRLNVPMGGLVSSDDALTAFKNYPSLHTEVLNIPLDKFVTLSYNSNPPAGKTATGNVPKTSEYIKGATATASSNPDNMKVQNYKFLSWNTKPDGSGTSYDPNVTFTITEDTVLYAQWEKVKYYVKLDYQGGNPGVFNDKAVMNHNTYNSRKTAIMGIVEGSGNRDAQLLTFEYQIGESMRVALARFYGLETNYSSYYMHFILPGTNDPMENINGYTSWHNHVPTSKNGYTATIAGTGKVPWYMYQPNGSVRNMTSVDSTIPDEAYFDENNTATLYITWTPKTGYTVKYDSQGGTEFADDTNLNWESSVSDLSKLKVPVKDGFAFVRWEYEEKAVPDTASYGALAGEDTVTEITLKAVYTEKTYTVHYDANGGTAVPSRTVKFTQENMNAVSSTKNPGYVFVGWSVDGTEATLITPEQTYSDFVNGDRAVSDIELIAVWKAATGYTVLFDTNGGTAVSDKSGLPFDATDLLSDTETTKKGYTFDKWTYIENDLKIEDAYTYAYIVNGDESVKTITLKANWKAKNYTIKYTNVETPIDDLTAQWESDKLLPTSNPQKKGYTFTGWTYKDAPVTQKNTVSGLIPEDDEETNTLIMVANWEIDDTYMVVYESNGGTYVLPKTGMRVTDDKLIPGGVIRQGYDLVGWCSDAELTEPATNDTTVGAIVPDGEHTAYLYAKWQPKTGFTVKYNLAGGTAANGDATIPDKTVAWTDAGLTPAQDPVRVGYAFTGWMYGTKSVDETKTFDSLAVTEDKNPVTLVATWKKADMTIYSKTSYYTQMSYNEPWDMDFYALLMDENNKIMNVTYGYSAYVVYADTMPDVETMLQHPVSGVNVTRLSSDVTKYSEYNYIHFSVKDIPTRNSKQTMWVMFSVETSTDGATSTYYSSIKARSLYNLAQTISVDGTDKAVIGAAFAGYVDAFEQYKGIDFTPVAAAPAAAKATALNGVTVGASLGMDYGEVTISAGQPDAMTFTSSLKVDSSWLDYGMILLEDRDLTSDGSAKYCFTESHLSGNLQCTLPHLTAESMILQGSTAVLYSKKAGNIDTTSAYIQAQYVGRTYIYQMNTPLHYAFFYQDSNGVYHFTEVSMAVPYILLNEIAAAGSGNEAELARAAVALFNVIYTYQMKSDFIWQ